MQNSIENQKERPYISFVLLETKPADMPEDTNKTLPAANNNGSCSSRKVIQTPCKETGNGCECGATSCESCPAASGMKIGPDRDVDYRNILSYLKIAAVILIITFIVKEALILLPI